MYKVQTASVILIIILTFNACKKYDFSSNVGKKLVKIIATETDSVGTMSFDYDQNERVIGIYESVNNKNNYQRQFFYDASGKLIRSEELYVPTNSFWKASYTYSNDRIIIKVNADGFGEINKNVYTYNTRGNLISDTLYRSGSQNYTDYTTFEYNQSANIEKVEFFSNYFGTWQKMEDVQARYNNVLNPYIDIGLMYYITKQDDEHKYTSLSKNLVTGLTTGSGPINYQYEYYNNGLPKRVFITSGYTDRTRLSTIEFFYK